MGSRNILRMDGAEEALKSQGGGNGEATISRLQPDSARAVKASTKIH